MANSPITPVKVNYLVGDVLTAQNLNDEASAINRIAGFTTQASANATTTLTVASNAQQEFTGTTAGQIVQTPLVSTLGLGMFWEIVNNSTQSITVNSSGSNLISVIPSGTYAYFTCVLTTGTAAASWNAQVMVTLTATQTLANKTFVDPVITTATALAIATNDTLLLTLAGAI